MNKNMETIMGAAITEVVIMEVGNMEVEVVEVTMIMEAGTVVIKTMVQDMANPKDMGKTIRRGLRNHYKVKKSSSLIWEVVLYKKSKFNLEISPMVIQLIQLRFTEMIILMLTGLVQVCILKVRARLGRLVL